MQQLIGRFLAFATIAVAVGCSSGKTLPNHTPGGCSQLVEPDNNAFCSSDTCNPALDCSKAKQRPVSDCCVLVGSPGAGQQKLTLKRTTDTKKYAGSGPPDISCFDPAHYPTKPPAGTPKTVTMQGLVQAFSNGCDMVGVKVEVYTVKRTGDPATDGDLDKLIGSAVTTDANSAVTLTESTNCGSNNDQRSDRAYSYPNVPMYTELVVKTSDAGQGQWAPLVTYNVYITDADVQNGVYQHDVDALAADDFQTIPTVAINRPISAGNGAIGGEIHDCGDVRLQNARVDVTAQRTDLVYFNADEDNPLPDSNRREIGTGRTALYAALDVKPGFARMAATGLVPDGNGGTKLVSLGYYDVRVFPDSVTSVSLQGLRPFQVP